MRKGLSVLLAFILFTCNQITRSIAEESPSQKYGYINRNGEVVMQPKYDYADEFFSERARVFYGEVEDLFGSPKNGVFGYIDRSGIEVVPPIFEWASSFNESGLARVKKDGLYGVIDVNGHEVIPFIYENLREPDENCRLYIAKKDGKIGVIDPSGKTVVRFEYDYIECSYDKIYAFQGPVGGSYDLPRDTGTYTVMGLDGSILFDVESRLVAPYKDCFFALKNDLYALYSNSGKQLTDFKYSLLIGTNEGVILYWVSDSALVGLLDVKGNEVTEPRYTDAGNFINGNSVVSIDGKYHLIDKNGSIITKFDADYVSSWIAGGHTYSFQGNLEYSRPGEGTYHLIDIYGNKLSKSYHASECKNIGDYDVMDRNDLWFVHVDDGWLALDMTGKEVFAPINCDNISSCGSDRFIAKRGDKYALVDDKGILLTEYIWDKIEASSGNLIPVRSQRTEPDFRSVRWGMSIEEVKAKEGNNPAYTGKVSGRNAQYIGYDVTLMGKKAILVYRFGPNGLYEAFYIWKEKHSNARLYIDDYLDVKEQLTSKYGPSLYNDDEDWDTAAHKQYYSDNKGDALKYGYLTYFTHFSTPRTDIYMQMAADNYEISFDIFYESRNIMAPTEDYSDVF